VIRSKDDRESEVFLTLGWFHHAALYAIDIGAGGDAHAGALILEGKGVPFKVGTQLQATMAGLRSDLTSMKSRGSCWIRR
jgi:hypothetical protein